MSLLSLVQWAEYCAGTVLVTKHSFSCLWWLERMRHNPSRSDCVGHTSFQQPRPRGNNCSNVHIAAAYPPFHKAMYAHVVDLDTQAIKTRWENPLAGAGWMLIYIGPWGFTCEFFLLSPLWRLVRQYFHFDVLVTGLLPIGSVSFSSLRWQFGAVRFPPDRRYHECWADINTMQQQQQQAALWYHPFYYFDVPAVIFSYFRTKTDGRPLLFWIRTKWDPSDGSLKTLYNDLFFIPGAPPNYWSFSSPPWSSKNTQETLSCSETEVLVCYVLLNKESL